MVHCTALFCTVNLAEFYILFADVIVISRQ